jgi:hypothetical protein
VKRFPLVARVALLALVWSSTAQAKELASFEACGASGCKAVTEPAALRALMKGLQLQGEPVTTETPTPAPFFRLEFKVRGDEGMTPSFTQYYVPSAGTIAIQFDPGSSSWVKVGALDALYRKVTSGVKPYGTPTFTAAALGGKPLADPASYRRLFTLRGESDDFPSNPDWLPFTFKSSHPSPWTTHAATLEYSPSTNVLWRGVEYIKLSNRLAGNVEHQRSLAAPASGGGFPWVPLLGALGSAVVLGGGAFMVRRRRAGRPQVARPTAVPD